MFCRSLAIGLLLLVPIAVNAQDKTERYAFFFIVELQNFYIDFIADIEDFRGMLYATPRHVSNVQKSIHPTEVNERTVISDVLDHAFNNRTLFH